MIEKPKEEDMTPGLQKYWDRVTEQELNPDKAFEARRKETGYVNFNEVSTKILGSDAIAQDGR